MTLLAARQLLAVGGTPWCGIGIVVFRPFATPLLRFRKVPFLVWAHLCTFLNLLLAAIRVDELTFRLIEPLGRTFRFRYKRAGETFVMVLGEYGKQGMTN
jgi:hypothetical protein